MDVLIISDKPTQFDAPFFRYIAASETSIKLRVLYTSGNRSLYDPELLQEVSWGIDLLKDYTYSVLYTGNSVQQLYRLIKPSDFVLVCGHGSLPALVAYGLCFFLDKRCAIRLDTVDWRNQSRFKLIVYKRPLFALLNVVCSYFLACGSRTRNFLTMVSINPSKIKRFPYIVDTDWFATASAASTTEQLKVRGTLQISTGNAVILAVVKLSARESPAELLRAIALLPQKQISLLIIGDGPKKEELLNAASGLSAPKQVIFAGYVPYTDLPLYYGLADVFVHAVADEPWGVSVQEAMACGLPVVTSDCVGAGYDLIRPGQNGFMYPFGQAQTLAQRIDEALNLPRQQVSEVNRAVLQEWSYATVWNELRSLILERPLAEQPAVSAS